MKKTCLVLIIGIFLLGACAQPTAEQPLEVSSAWARPANSGQTSAVYFTIRNPNAKADQLLRAVSSAARTVELHMSMEDSSGVMSMHPQESVEIPAKGQVEFIPGGLHVMLIDLTQDLKTGESLTLTLEFDHSEPIRIEVPIQEQP